MKHSTFVLSIAVFGLFVILSFTQCNSPSAAIDKSPAGAPAADASLNIDVMPPAADGFLASLQNQQTLRRVSDSILPGASGLQYMREEEKLARDVYVYMNQKWNRRVFANINSSEQVHMNAIKYLLTTYNISDPVGNNGPGVFSNSHLQVLYNELISSGEVSLVEALKVGAAIEEIDMLDIRGEIAVNVGYPDVIRVYNNLAAASAVHLKAFVFNLKTLGVNYTPMHMTQSEFDELMNAK